MRKILLMSVFWREKLSIGRKQLIVPAHSHQSGRGGLPPPGWPIWWIICQDNAHIVRIGGSFFSSGELPPPFFNGALGTCTRDAASICKFGEKDQYSKDEVIWIDTWHYLFRDTTQDNPRSIVKVSEQKNKQFII